MWVKLQYKDWGRGIICYAINVKFSQFLDASSSTLKRHLHNTRKSETNATSVTSNLFKEHILKIIVKSYTCNKCDSRSYLKTTTYDPPFWEKLCKKKSLYICFGGNLRRHLTIHSGSRSWRSRPLISWFWCQGDGREGRSSSTAPARDGLLPQGTAENFYV